MYFFLFSPLFKWSFLHASESLQSHLASPNSSILRKKFKVFFSFYLSVFCSVSLTFSLFSFFFTKFVHFLFFSWFSLKKINRKSWLENLSRRNRKKLEIFSVLKNVWLNFLMTLSLFLFLFLFGAKITWIVSLRLSVSNLGRRFNLQKKRKKNVNVQMNNGRKKWMF